jgi:hypothetical protein
MLEESMMQPLRGKGELRGKAQERLATFRSDQSKPPEV